MVRGFCFFCLILLAAPAVFAQTCTSYVVVDAFDGETTLGIDHLKARDFEARTGNASLPVISATQGFSNRVLVLVEISGNSYNWPMLATARGMARIARTASAGRPIAFGVFAEEAFISKEFYANPQKRSSAIDDVLTQAERLPGKDPALFDSLHQALATFGPHQPGDTVVLITDFHDHKSKHNPADLTKEFTAAGTRLVVVFEKGHIRRTTDTRRYIKDENRALQLLSSRTGGMYFDNISAPFLNFAWAGYMLGIQIPNTWDKPKEWKLQLKDADGKIDKKALVVFPQHLVPCISTVTAAAR